MSDMAVDNATTGVERVRKPLPDIIPALGLMAVVLVLWEAVIRLFNVPAFVLPALEESAAVLVPSGHRGPAFLVYKNFDVIMRWNRSEHFALSVGILSDRIAGAGALRTPPPNDPQLTREQVAAQLKGTLIF